MVLSMYCDIFEDLLIGGLFYSNESRPQLIGYANARFLFNPYKDSSQIGYLFKVEVQLYHGAQQNEL